MYVIIMMKKYILFSLLMSMAALSWGKHVPEQQAGVVASTFLSARVETAVSVRNIVSGGSDTCYV